MILVHSLPFRSETESRDIVLRYLIMFNGGSADGRLFEFRQFGKQAQQRLGCGCAPYSFLADCEIAPDRLVREVL